MFSGKFPGCVETCNFSYFLETLKMFWKRSGPSVNLPSFLEIFIFYFLSLHIFRTIWKKNSRFSVNIAVWLYTFPVVWKLSRLSRNLPEYQEMSRFSNNCPNSVETFVLSRRFPFYLEISKLWKYFSTSASFPSYEKILSSWKYNWSCSRSFIYCT